jgi:hypothetical protein
MDFIDITAENDNNLTIGESFFSSAVPQIPNLGDKETEGEAESPAVSAVGEALDADEETAGERLENSEAVVAEEIGKRDESVDEEDKEIESFMLDDYKIIGQLRPQDCYVIQKLRNGVIVPTWQVPGTSGRQIGKVLKISGDTAAEYTENLERAGDSCFPQLSTNRALEVIY